VVAHSKSAADSVKACYQNDSCSRDSWKAVTAAGERGAAVLMAIPETESIQEIHEKQAASALFRASHESEINPSSQSKLSEPAVSCRPTSTLRPLSLRNRRLEAAAQAAAGALVAKGLAPQNLNSHPDVPPSETPCNLLDHTTGGGPSAIIQATKGPGLSHGPPYDENLSGVTPLGKLRGHGGEGNLPGLQQETSGLDDTRYMDWKVKDVAGSIQSTASSNAIEKSGKCFFVSFCNLFLTSEIRPIVMRAVHDFP
jgi:hypothetical protein